METEPSRLRVGISVKSPVAGTKADEPNLNAVTTAAKLLVDAVGNDLSRWRRAPE